MDLFAVVEVLAMPTGRYETTHHGVPVIIEIAHHEYGGSVWTTVSRIPADAAKQVPEPLPFDPADDALSRRAA